MSVAHGRRPAGLEHRDRPDHHPHRRLEALPGRRHGRWSSSASRLLGHDRRDHAAVAWSASSWRSSASASARPCRTSCSRCRTTPPRPTWVRPARWSRSSARMGGSIGVSALGAVLSPPGRRTRSTDGPGRARASRRRGHAEPRDPRPARRCRRPVRGALRAAPSATRPAHLFLVALPFAVRGPGLRAVHPRGAAAHHDPTGRDELAPGGRRRSREHRGRAAADAGDRAARRVAAASSSSEVGVLIRRIKRVIGERARAVHPDLQPASYLMLAYLADDGPLRSSAIAEAFGIDKGAISRQVQHLVDLGLVDRTPDPADGRATLRLGQRRRRAPARRRGRTQRREWLDERLGDWSDDGPGRLRRRARPLQRRAGPPPAARDGQPGHGRQGRQPWSRRRSAAARPRCRRAASPSSGPLATSTSPAGSVDRRRRRS